MKNKEFKQEILKQNGLYAPVFMAPGHTYMTKIRSRHCGIWNLPALPTVMPIFLTVPGDCCLYHAGVPGQCFPAVWILSVSIAMICTRMITGSWKISWNGISSRYFPFRNSGTALVSGQDNKDTPAGAAKSAAAQGKKFTAESPILQAYLQETWDADTSRKRKNGCLACGG